jgi:serine/threonine protein kinase
MHIVAIALGHKCSATELGLTEPTCLCFVVCTACYLAGETTGLSFPLNYAAPELLAAEKAGEAAVTADPAADVWALGLVAFELLTARRAFAPGTPISSIRNAICGHVAAPWEAAGSGGSLDRAAAARLRVVRLSIQKCLTRSQSDRPTASEVASTWRNALEFASVKQSVVHR